MIFLGLLLSGFCIYGLTANGAVQQGIPIGMWWASLFFSLFIVGISALGMCGARTQSKMGLAIYILVVTACVVAQVVAFIYVLVKLGYINTSEENEYKIAKEEKGFVQDFVDEVTASDHAVEWKDFQDKYQCCGFDLKVGVEYIVGGTNFLDDKLHTGKYCDTTPSYVKWAAEGMVCKAAGSLCNLKDVTNAINGQTANPKRTFFCADVLYSRLRRYINYIAGTAGVLALFQLVSLFSACRLACCVSTKEGGHMEHWRPSKRDQTYQANELTGTV